MNDAVKAILAIMLVGAIIAAYFTNKIGWDAFGPIALTILTALGLYSGAKAIVTHIVNMMSRKE